MEEPIRVSGRRGLGWSSEPATPKLSDDGSTNNSILTMSGVTKTYVSAAGEPTVALDPVDGHISAQEFVSLVGPSGCGKTTLLKIAAGLMQPTEGRVTYRNTGEVVQPGKFGMVFQTPALLPWRTVRENILLPADILSGLSRKNLGPRADQLLDTVKLTGSGTKYPGELSGGMQQRASIARALLNDPEILFMDEPFGALDAMTREELNMELQRLQLEHRKTVMFITHSIQEAVLLSDRILVFSGSPGRVVANVRVEFARPRGTDVQLEPEFRELEAVIRESLNATWSDTAGP